MKRATGDPLVTAFYDIISIHALVKRATLTRLLGNAMRSYFNPRPREEGDKSASTSCLTASNFNPRPREEGDRRPLQTRLSSHGISIHALVKRATFAPDTQNNVYAFQSTPS